MAEEQAVQSRKTRHLILAGLLVPCLLICIPAITAYRAERRLADSFHWVAHTIEVQHQLQRLWRLIVEGESSSRGFLLTGRADFLEPYETALGQIPREIEAIRETTSDNPTQQEHIRQLKPLVQKKLEFMAENLVLHRRGEERAAADMVGTGRGNETMNAIRTRLNSMGDEESRLLTVRQEALHEHARFSTIMLAALVGVSLLFAVAIWHLVRRVSKLQHFVTMCAWSRTVEYEGEWLSFEEYLHRRFDIDTSHGMSPAESEKFFGKTKGSASKIPVAA